jgi:hypothetical protein
VKSVGRLRKGGGRLTHRVCCKSEPEADCGSSPRRSVWAGTAHRKGDPVERSTPGRVSGLV